MIKVYIYYKDLYLIKLQVHIFPDKIELGGQLIHSL